MDRPPDTYLKSVLTFGDRPAPAMAQIALRKTDEKGETSHPHASQVLKNNTYMDDICDSVSSVLEAQKLTKDLDDVVEKGGFKVKEWLSNESLEQDQFSETKGQGLKLLQGKMVEQVLIVIRNIEKDTFTFKVKANVNDLPSKKGPHKSGVTKRVILS